MRHQKKITGCRVFEIKRLRASAWRTFVPDARHMKRRAKNCQGSSRACRSSMIRIRNFKVLVYCIVELPFDKPERFSILDIRRERARNWSRRILNRQRINARKARVSQQSDSGVEIAERFRSRTIKQITPLVLNKSQRTGDAVIDNRTAAAMTVFGRRKLLQQTF